MAFVGSFHPQQTRPWIINMLAACMQLMHKWQLKMQGMFIQEGMEGVSIWVVESKYIHASNPDEAESFYEPANDKVYRHPTFYDLPDEVKHM